MTEEERVRLLQTPEQHRKAIAKALSKAKPDAKDSQTSGLVEQQRIFKKAYKKADNENP